VTITVTGRPGWLKKSTDEGVHALPAEVERMMDALICSLTPEDRRQGRGAAAMPLDPFALCP
jgi:hypothetical protein